MVFCFGFGVIRVVTRRPGIVDLIEKVDSIFEIPNFVNELL
jgi:hypothetical protein